MYKTNSAKLHHFLSKGVFLVVFTLFCLFTVSPSFTKAATSEVELLAVGDDLIHSRVIAAAKQKNGKYDFSNMFKSLKKEIQAADIAAINQETILVDSNFTGYPSFGSPKTLADAIADAGFDVVTHATNHTMDRGTAAITGTLNYWKTKHPDVKVLGIHDSQKAASKITVVRKNGIRIAMLNYTYGLNGYRLPAGKSYMVDLLNSQTKIREDIKKAKKVSDFVVVFAHMGMEYVYSPDYTQNTWTNFFLNEGVDLLIGTHPHVLQPYKMLKNKSGHKMLVYYSLGNFVSCQTAVPRLLGGMAKITIVKDSKGTRIKKYTMDPLVTHISKGCTGFRVYKLTKYTDALAKSNAIHQLSPYETFTPDSLKKLYKRITGKTVK